MKEKKVHRRKQVKRIDKRGMIPGKIVFTGERKMKHADVQLIIFNENFLDISKHELQEIPKFVSPVAGKVTWYDIRCLHDVVLLEAIGKQYAIHPLILEDIADTHQRPKFDEYDNGVFITIKALRFNPLTVAIDIEQVSIFMGKDIIISFQEEEDDLFVGVRDRINSGRGKIRKRSVDYLGYALLDNIVDNYFNVLDKVEEEIEKLEFDILNTAQSDSKAKNHNLKREMLTLRKAVQPLREAINKFAKSESPFVAETTEVFLRDLYDHTIQVMDMVETYRDVLTGLHDLYLSEISYKMNQVMQVLTVVSAIFIPLSFLTGVYGMNFENMPELKSQNGYFVLVGVMVILVSVLLYYFKKHKWI